MTLPWAPAPPLLVAALVLAASCGAEERVAQPTKVVVTMTEYAFAHRRPVPPGRVVFRVRNVGRVDHELVLVALAADVPPLDAQLRGRERRAIPTIARVTATEPGATGIFAADLKPGRYGFICFLSDPDGTQHSLKGMSSDFLVDD